MVPADECKPRSPTAGGWLLPLLCLGLGCFAPAVDPRGKLCTGGCPSPYVCGLAQGGGPPVCQGRFALQDHCADSPHLCGFPDHTNVGVPVGTLLRRVPADLSEGPGWHWDAPTATLLVDGDGGVVDAVDVVGNIDVFGKGVRVSRSRVTAVGGMWGVDFEPPASGGLIVDSEVLGGDAQAGRVGQGVIADVGNDTLVVQRVHIAYAAVGVWMRGGQISDVFIESMGKTGSDSPSSIVSNGGGGLTVSHSTVFMNIDGNCAVCLFQDTGAPANDLVTGNLLAGGGYLLYGGGGTGATHDIRITGNRFSRLFHPNGGVYGAVAYFANDPGNVFAGNVWDDTNAEAGQ